MKPISAFRYFLLTHFGKPAADRELYKLVRELKAQSILEIGLGDGSRAETIIRLAQKFGVSETVRYTGVDLFEARQDSTWGKLTLKETHKRLQGLGSKSQLVPGNPASAIPRIANSHLRTDLVIISGEWSAEELQDCWSYFPRMLHAQSVVMLQTSLGQAFQRLSRLEVEKLATAPQQRAQQSQAA